MRLAIAALVLLLSSCALQPSVETVRRQFTATFKNMPLEKVEPSEIDGLYEIYSGGRLIYFAPKPNLVVFGELYTIAGESVSQTKAALHLAARVLDIPPDIGVRIGDGPLEVVGFLDPDCGHCAQAHDWFEQRGFEGITLRAIFMPLEPGSDAFARAQQLECAPPALKREAFRQLYLHDSPAHAQPYLACDTAAGELQRQAQVARDFGVNGTPTFLVKGQTVLGFNQERLEALLPPTTKESDP